MSAKDDLKIFQNILAQSPNGLGDPDLIGKFSKAKAQLNQFDSMSAIQAQNIVTPPASMPPMGGQMPIGGQMPPEQQQPMTPPIEGNGTMNLP